MADKDLGDGPSLEMPSLGSIFKRKKKDKGPAPDENTVTTEDFDALVRGETTEKAADKAAAAPEADDEPTVIVPALEDPVAVEESPAPVVVDEQADSATPADAEETVVLDETPSPAPGASTVNTGTSTDDPDMAPEAAEDDPVTILDEEPETTVESAAATAPVAASPIDPSPVDVPEDVDPDEHQADADEEEVDQADEESEPRPKRQFTLPPLAARTASAITGLVIGLVAVGLTYGSLRGCEAIQGTSSCGSPGFFLLAAIMIILIALGSSLLGAWKVVDPTSTSFLAVGLLAVIALLFLVRVIFSPWMIVVIPLVAVVTYTASHWLTSLFEDEDVVTS